MLVQAVFMDEVSGVRGLRYIWSEDGALLLALDCCWGVNSEILTFGELFQHLGALCWWQMKQPVMVGFNHAVAEVMTLYHAFEFPDGAAGHSLMLVSTPPDEYFESKAA